MFKNLSICIFFGAATATAAAATHTTIFESADCTVTTTTTAGSSKRSRSGGDPPPCFQVGCACYDGSTECDPGLVCDHNLGWWSCENDPSCGHVNEVCASDGDCCGGSHCDSLQGICAPDGEACHTDGAWCGSSIADLHECCEGFECQFDGSSEAGNEQKYCTFVETGPCVGLGEQCERTAQCCEGFCYNDGVCSAFRAEPELKSEKKVRVYYPEWALYEGRGSYDVMNTPHQSYSDVTYSFFFPQPSEEDWNNQFIPGYNAEFGETSAVWDPNYSVGEIRPFDVPASLETDFGGYKGQLRALVAEAAKLNKKVMVSIGGWSLSFGLSKILRDSSTRGVFIQSMVELAQEFDLGGIDIDWESPGCNCKEEDSHCQGSCIGYHEGSTHDKGLATTLFKSLRHTLDATGQQHVKISTAAMVRPYTLDFYAGALPYIDEFMLMTYDFHGGFDLGNSGGYQANVYPSFEGDPFNVDLSVDYLIDVLQYAPHKILIGSPFYARGWTSDGDSIFSKVTGTLPSYDNSGELGVTAARDFHKMWETCIPQPDDLQSLGSHCKGLAPDYETWTYDSLAMAAAKAKYVCDKGLGGIGLWDITDDAAGMDTRSGHTAAIVDEINKCAPLR